LSKTDYKLPQVIFGRKATFDTPAFCWRDSEMKTVHATEDFWFEPANFVYLRNISLFIKMTAKKLSSNDCLK